MERLSTHQLQMTESMLQAFLFKTKGKILHEKKLKKQFLKERNFNLSESLLRTKIKRLMGLPKGGKFHCLRTTAWCRMEMPYNMVSYEKRPDRYMIQTLQLQACPKLSRDDNCTSAQNVHGIKTAT